ncbi:MAG: T9SS type A sorting domain-containing protein [Bacteroidetes bacterium]|nr:T9SS type A sorting domain-containing protein [Bacteroidota bacterium]
MKSFLTLLFALICCIGNVKAATGDTTIVQGVNDKWIGDVPVNIDSMMKFPDGSKSYRKIIMVFTLGKYACPGNPTYCGQWDYTVNMYLIKPSKTVELGRFITPYAGAWGPRTPMTWKGEYAFDVTDYYPLIKDSGIVRVHYSGYSGGYTANVKFIFIEGTPPRNVIDIDRVWNGSFQYGGATSIETNVPQKTLNAPSGTQFTEMKFCVSGHGSDNNYCSEFCKKYYKVMLNGSQTDQMDIWKNNCGQNELYPQTGTWIYDRANWCPGEVVRVNTHKLGGITGGNYNLDVDFETYNDNGNASYIVDGAVIYYGGFNNNVDVSLEAIVAPTDNPSFFRSNPTGKFPKVIIRNTGATAITNIKFDYGVGSTMRQYTWQGNLNSLDSTLVVFPEVPELRTASGSNILFTVKALEVNGAADGDASNNTLYSYFTGVPTWPMKIIVSMLTNKGDAGGGISESSWKIVDAIGTVWAKRENCAISSSYVDTVTLGPGAYELLVDDKNCDGMNFPLYAQGGGYNPGAGTLAVRGTTSLANLQLSKYFSGDFGCGFSQFFNVIWPAAITNVNDNTAAMDVYPNPATNNVNVVFAGINNVKGKISLIDMMGRVVLQQPCQSAQKQINTAQLNNGIYNVVFESENGEAGRLQSRLVIAK